MSFSGNIKEELERVNVSSRHCRLAEMAAIYDFCGKRGDETDGKMVISSENELAVRKYFTLLCKTFNMNKDYGKTCAYAKYGAYYTLVIADAGEAERVRSAISVASETMRSCCRRAYIRGAFLAAGSVSDPEKSYHLEIVCQDETRARFLAGLLGSFEIDARITTRKKYHILYVKD